MARRIAITNQKGGVTKTTSTFNIAAALSSQGKKVLMIDLDSQGSLTISAGYEPLDLSTTICDILKKDPIKTSDAIINVEHIDNLYLVGSIIDLAALEIEMLSRPARETILSRALKSIDDQFDFILIDCPPQLSILTMNGLSAADEIIIPVKTDYLAYRGLTQLNETIDVIKEFVNPEVKVSGVIAALYESRVKGDNEILDLLKTEYNVIGVIKKAAAAKKGIYDGLPVVLQDKSSDISKEYSRIANLIIKNYK